MQALAGLFDTVQHASTSGNVFFYIVAPLIVLLVAWGARSGYKFFKNLSKTVEEMRDSWLGAPPNKFNKTPEPGIAAIVENHTHILDDMRADLKDLSDKTDSLLRSATVLVDDSHSNDGSTSRDALDRIETKVTRPEETRTRKGDK
jgi:hypothetical protein